MCCLAACPPGAGMSGWPQMLQRPASPGLVGAMTDGLRLVTGGWASRGPLPLVQVRWDGKGLPLRTSLALLPSTATACT